MGRLQFTSTEVIVKIIELAPGLIDGQEDDASPPDVMEHLGFYMRHLDADFYHVLRSIAAEQRELEK